MTLLPIRATVAEYRGIMRYGRFVAAVVLVCGLGAYQLFAQAAAESVLTHGLASGAGSSLGKTLGSAIGNAASQLGGRLGQQTSTVPAVQRVPTTRVKPGFVPAAATTASTSSAGSLIASIQGGATSSPAQNCAVTPSTAPANSSQTKVVPAGAPVADTKATAARPAAPATNCQPAQDADAHPAVVNLPAAN